jgi:hypothetical protein
MNITYLEENEVLVIRSNSTGFHGAGSAGLACYGEAKNTWRTDPWFLKAIKFSVGSPDRIGKRAVYGMARDYQVGREGASYAIKTIVRPGQKCSTPLSEIKEQLIELSKFSSEHKDFRFIMTPVGTGLVGWKKSEMKVIWDEVMHYMPSNVIYSLDLYSNVNVL